MHPSKEIFNFDQCSDCNFVFINPRLPQNQLADYYTSYYLPYRGAQAWGKYKNLVQKSQQKIDAKRLKYVRNTQNINENSLILDIGCGKPSFLKLCQEQLNCQTLGLDFSDNGWKNQHHKFSKLNLKVGEITDLPLQLKPDVISMWHYLEHDYKPLENLKYLQSISKPETKLIIEVPNFNSESRKQFGPNWAGWHTPRHTSLFSPNNIKLLLHNSGWHVNKIFTFGTMDSYVLHWMSKMEEKNIAWDKNMENEFIDFVWGKLKFIPQKMKEKNLSLGIMTIVASPKMTMV